MTKIDYPDGTLQTTPSLQLTEKAITSLDYVSIADTDYHTVASWTVAAGKKGVLRRCEMETDSYSIARWRLTIAGVQQFTGIQIISACTLEYPDVVLAEADQVLLEATSSDGSAIAVNGDITGKEMG